MCKKVSIVLKFGFKYLNNFMLICIFNNLSCKMLELHLIHCERTPIVLDIPNGSITYFL